MTSTALDLNSVGVLSVEWSIFAELEAPGLKWVEPNDKWVSEILTYYNHD